MIKIKPEFNIGQWVKFIYDSNESDILDYKLAQVVGVYSNENLSPLFLYDLEILSPYIDETGEVFSRVGSNKMTGFIDDEFSLELLRVIVYLQDKIKSKGWD